MLWFMGIHAINDNIYINIIQRQMPVDLWHKMDKSNVH